jgi:hypothetical protein
MSNGNGRKNKSRRWRGGELKAFPMVTNDAVYEKRSVG